MISIIIPVLGQDYYTEQVLADIKEKIKEDHEVIVLDWPEWVNEKWNKGVDMAKGEIIFIINNDIVLTLGLVWGLLALLDSYKIACPFTTRGKHKFMTPVFKKDDNIAGWCFMMKKKDWVPIDPRLDIWYGDDWIFHTQNKDVGYKWLVHHFESKTLRSPEIVVGIRKRIENDKLAWQEILKEHPEWKPNTIKLSILIPSVPSRIAKLSELLVHLNKQIKDEVELIIYTDNKKISLGEKRNKMFALSHWQYIVQVDDDDGIAPNYVEKLLEKIKEWRDCICFDVECYINGRGPTKAVYGKDLENRDVGDFHFRKPNHLMCYRRDILSRAKWRDLTYGEDFFFSNDITPFIKTESRIDEFLYIYNYNEAETECPKVSNLVKY